MKSCLLSEAIVLSDPDRRPNRGTSPPETLSRLPCSRPTASGCVAHLPRAGIPRRTVHGPNHGHLHVQPVPQIAVDRVVVIGCQGSLDKRLVLTGDGQAKRRLIQNMRHTGDLKQLHAECRPTLHVVQLSICTGMTECLRAPIVQTRSPMLSNTSRRVRSDQYVSHTRQGAFRTPPSGEILRSCAARGS